MPVTLIATAGAANANSYATVAEANAYNDAQVNGGTWAALDVPSKNRALTHATRLLDDNIAWIGERATDQQALEWPRAWARNRSGNFYSEQEVPMQVKYATAELARRLTETGGSTGGASGTENLKRLKAGPVELEFKDDAVIETPSAVPDDVFQMVRFLAVRASGEAVSRVPVYRV